MAPSTRVISSSNVNGDGMDDNTRRYVDDALVGIRRSMEEMLNQITALSLQNQVVNGEFRPRTRYAEDQKVRLICVHLFDKALLWHRLFLKVYGDNVTCLYLGGLPTEIEMDVRMFKPQTLTDAYCLTNLQKATLNAVKKKSKMQFSASTSRYETPPRKQLTRKEYEDKRAKNLCFYCDKKFVLSHKYKGQLFSLVLFGENEEIGEEFVDADDSLEDIGKEFGDVFALPTELPPKRTHVHRTPLLEGVPPANIRPYRHPPIQKDAIEAMVKELLKSGAIKPSQSPFASPIVMDKKKRQLLEDVH
uniref:Reverse transcriptase n=1 Tax=Tanacetum cinerariifolium TaxID=118510 RepID=A0A6L2JL07_TANCI|nr:reverse transcriptase [Tanacetum cinerariifolium]